MSNKIAEKKEKIKESAHEKRAEKINKKAAPQSAVTNNRLKLLITTVERNKSEYYADLIQSFDVNMQMFALAHGTANANMLSLLGLTNSEKTVIFSVIQESKIEDCLQVLGERFKTVKGGKGIAFTVPLTSLIGTLLFGFLSNNKKAIKENGNDR